MISFVPVYALTSPPPNVETITLGTPTGRTRIPAVAMDVPPLPPMPRIPSSLPSSYSLRTMTAMPVAIVFIASSLCSPERKNAMSPPPALATSSRPMSGSKTGSPRTPKSTIRVLSPCFSMRSLTKANSSPFVSSEPTRTTVFPILEPPFRAAYTTRLPRSGRQIQARRNEITLLNH